MTETSGMQLDDDSLLSLFSKVKRFLKLQISNLQAADGRRYNLL